MIDIGVPSLQVLSLRALSAFNLSYGGTEDYPFVTNVVYHISRVMGSRLLKFPKPWCSFRPGFDFECVNLALKFYYSYCVRSKTRVKFRFRAEDMNLIPLGAKKNGFDAWPELPPIESKYCKYIFTTHPTKNQAAINIFRDFSNFVICAANMIREGCVPIEKNFKQPITSLSFKDENRSCIDENSLHRDKVRDYANKGRIFALFKDSIIGRLLSFRKIERTYYPDFDKIYPGSRNLSCAYRNRHFMVIWWC